jgi:thiol-disulfide isomerase/thioredoxin
MRLSLAPVTVLTVLALSSIGQAAQPDTLRSVSKGEFTTLTESSGGHQEPATSFLDAKGNPVTLAKLNAKGKILVVDLWATWCGGCVHEMPTLAKLQSAYPGRIIVAPISMDASKDREKARAFIAQFPQLPFYQNPAEHWPPAITTALKPSVGSFPTAIIFDRFGKERARMVGKTADWSSRDARELFDYLLSERSDSKT